MGSYILIMVFSSSGMYATTFESNFQVFETKIGCETAQVYINSSIPKSDDITKVVACIPDFEIPAPKVKGKK